jgi:hypothetical protein
VTMKNALFWDAAPYRPCVNRRFGGTYRLHLQGRNIRKRATCSCWFLVREFFYSEDGGDTFLRNVDSYKIYMAPQPRRRHSSTLNLLLSYFQNLYLLSLPYDFALHSGDDTSTYAWPRVLIKLSATVTTTRGTV